MSDERQEPTKPAPPAPPPVPEPEKGQTPPGTVFPINNTVTDSGEAVRGSTDE